MSVGKVGARVYEHGIVNESDLTGTDSTDCTTY